MTAFLQERLKLRANEAKSAYARPWERKFLGYTLTISRGQLRLRFAHESEARLRGRIRELMRWGRGRSLDHTIEALNPVLRGWSSYFRLSESRQAWKTWTDRCVNAFVA